jgi:hypothetical protein
MLNDKTKEICHQKAGGKIQLVIPLSVIIKNGIESYNCYRYMYEVS